MQSTTKRCATALLAATLLLCSSSLMAALRSRSNPIHVKAHSVHLSRATRLRGHRTHGRTQALRSSRPRFRGQQAIDSERTLEIQQALIREHYLDGVPSGEWDQATRDALVRLQNDNHWQTKIIPDSRALIKLGLGPSPQNLLNPESAAVASAKPGPDPSVQPDTAQPGVN